MRLSTAQIYDSGVNGLLRNQYTQYRLQNQMSSGRKVVTPADDPVAAAQALAAEQKMNVNKQFLDNQGNAQAQLRELESLMSSVGDLLVDLKATWVNAGDGAYGETQLKSLATDVRAKYQQLLGIANNADAQGQYRFAGYQAGTRPFVESGGGVTYQGDSGERLLQVETSRLIPVNYSGRDFFQAIPQGNGVFVMGAGAGNTGSGIIENGTLASGSTYSGDSYQLTFTSPTTYDLVTNGGAPVSQTFTPGTPINLGGALVNISGAPAAGDVFTVEPSREESVFDTLNKFITTLENGNADAPEFWNAMLRIGASLDQAISHTSDSRAVVGTRMKELEDLTSLDSDLAVQYEQQITDLVYLTEADIYRVASELSKSGMQLEAARQTYLKVTGLSLFNYI
ncbi:MAG: flagellar hook-associated protein FlgL [Zoogloeaceae bacterium]|jgi:flagellar hook-associated protein 3 FlgL|nr:flagellar hook-associated protein FlgL [Zoogloeaceae bacterium]